MSGESSWHWYFILALLLAVLAGCQSETPTSHRVQVQLNWYPDAQFGGYYAAKLHGEYAAEGIEVEILAGGPDVTVLPKLAMGRVQFAVGNADQVLLARKEGADVVAVMAAMQDSPRCIMVHEKSGIRSLAELNNISLALGEGNPFAEFLKTNLPLEEVRIVPYAGSIAKFLVDDRFAQQGYVFSEPIVARQRGSDPLPLMVSELGFNPYTGLVITNRTMIEQRPELVKKFVHATVRGWRRYLEQPAVTNAEIYRLNPEMDLESLAQAVDVIRTLCLPPGSQLRDLGKMVPARWETLSGQLQQLGLLPTQDGAQASEAFTTRFLP